jgi:mRNA interferase RelE/StbE
MYKLLIDDKVVKDLKKIDELWQKKILTAIKSKLIKNPYLGKKLVGDLSLYYSYRIGNYRVLYELIENKMVIIVIKIKHRSQVYL